jgi:outer membrane protein OmpA-like peptidoglycan-associated protein
MIRLSPRPPGSSRALAQFLAFVLLGISLAANAVDVGFKIDPGVAFPLTQQQSQRFGVGGGPSAKLLLGLTPYLDVTGGISFLALPASGDTSGAGMAWGYGPGLRLKTRRDSYSFYGASPWVDADTLYVRTGGLNRFGFAAGAGVAFPLNQSRNFWLGPFVRYQQIVGSGGNGVDGRDAKVLFTGLSFEFGGGRERTVLAVAPAPAPEGPHCPAAAECPAAATLPDSDGDGVPDKFDRCPDVAGPAENQGCPVYEKVIVHEDKLELTEKIAFAKDTDRLEKQSFPLLDEVAKALQDHKTFHVSVEGHASSEGTDEHNQDLSERRAVAVLDYVAAHGIPRDRLSSKGFSSSRPLNSNDTPAGRESNRRVEFVVTIMILNKDGSVQ